MVKKRGLLSDNKSMAMRGRMVQEKKIGSLIKSGLKSGKD